MSASRISLRPLYIAASTGDCPCSFFALASERSASSIAFSVAASPVRIAAKNSFPFSIAVSPAAQFLVKPHAELYLRRDQALLQSCYFLFLSEKRATARMMADPGDGAQQRCCAPTTL